jgi:hypothetical protein
MQAVTFTLATAVLAVLAGCAQPGAVTQPSGPADCPQLERELAELNKARQDAAAKQSEAWKAIVPFAVVGRYASGKSAEAQAEQEIAARNAEMQRQGCARHGA